MNKGITVQFGAYLPPNNRKTESLLGFSSSLTLTLSLNSVFPYLSYLLCRWPHTYLYLHADFSRYQLVISSNFYDLSDFTSSRNCIRLKEPHHQSPSSNSLPLCISVKKKDQFNACIFIVPKPTFYICLKKLKATTHSTNID